MGYREVFIERIPEGQYAFWAGDRESLGTFTDEEISNGVEKEEGGSGIYSYEDVGDE